MGGGVKNYIKAIRALRWGESFEYSLAQRDARCVGVYSMLEGGRRWGDYVSLDVTAHSHTSKKPASY